MKPLYIKLILFLVALLLFVCTIYLFYIDWKVALSMIILQDISKGIDKIYENLPTN